MIVKVAGGRRDGKTSFGDLGKYLTAGILQSGESPLKSSWDALTQYITAESVLTALGEDVEKTIAVELGNLGSLQTAPYEMSAVARQNYRVGDPVYHYILSWPEGERPDTQDIFKAARHTLKALGMLEHQYIIAIHANTDNLHAHVEVNRVHPRTFKAEVLNWDHDKLHRAARECEIEFGWTHDSGIYEVVEVDGVKHVIKAVERIDPALLREGSAKRFGSARRYEVWNGQESLASWCRGEPATALKDVLSDPTLSSWQDVHRVLSQFGLELRASGGSGMKVFDIGGAATGESVKSLSVSASNAFRFMKRDELEKRLGAFEMRDATTKVVPEKTYKRDPLKRLQRKLERKAERGALKQRFEEECQAVTKQRALTKEIISAAYGREKDRLAELRKDYSEKRQSIINSPSLTPQQKMEMHVQNRLDLLKEKASLRADLGRQRAEQRSLIPAIPVWRAWIEQQAQLGDEAAISALRGMIYQDGREAKKATKTGQGAEPIDGRENSIRPSRAVDTDPYVRGLQNLVWKVAKNGRVDYAFKSGGAAFSDDGDKLVFGRRLVNDDALMTSIRYAADKWGGDLQLSGGDAVFKERVVRMAVAHGIRISNPELQPLQTQIQASYVRANPESRDPSYEDICNLIATRNKTAIVGRAAAGSKPFAGPIVGENSRYVAQHIGGNEYVIHDKNAFRLPLPLHGKPISIKYQKGNATVQARGGRDRGGR